MTTRIDANMLVPLSFRTILFRGVSLVIKVHFYKHAVTLVPYLYKNIIKINSSNNTIIVLFI